MGLNYSVNKYSKSVKGYAAKHIGNGEYYIFINSLYLDMQEEIKEKLCSHCDGNAEILIMTSCDEILMLE